MVAAFVTAAGATSAEGPTAGGETEAEKTAIAFERQLLADDLKAAKEEIRLRMTGRNTLIGFALPLLGVAAAQLITFHQDGFLRWGYVYALGGLAWLCVFVAALLSQQQRAIWTLVTYEAEVLRPAARKWAARGESHPTYDEWLRPRGLEGSSGWIFGVCVRCFPVLLSLVIFAANHQALYQAANPLPSGSEEEVFVPLSATLYAAAWVTLVASVGSGVNDFVADLLVRRRMRAAILEGKRFLAEASMATNK